MFFLNFDVVKFVVVTLSLGYYVCNIGPEFCLYYLTTYVMVNGRRMVVGVAAVVILRRDRWVTPRSSLTSVMPRRCCRCDTEMEINKINHFKIEF